MKFKTRIAKNKKMIVAFGTLLLLGATIVPLVNMMTKNTFVEEKSMNVSPNNIYSQENAVGDPEGPLGPPQVRNMNTHKYFNTIQTAIYDSDTHDGDIIQVNSSIYPENVIVNKSLTIRGIDTGAGLPVINGGSETGFVIAVNNVTIENVNISNTSTGIFCNHSGLTVMNNNFWCDNHSIDFNYTSNFNIDTNYRIYDNSIVGNLFLINTTNDLDGAVIMNLALNYQNHSGTVTIGDFTITDNRFLLNDSHAYAVLYNENYIKSLKDGSISIGSFNFSDNTLYKTNSENNGVYFNGSLTDLKNDGVTVGDIIVSNNMVMDQTNAAFSLEQYMVENWSGTTNGVFGDILILDNIISSSSINSDGIQISDIFWWYLRDDASLTVGDCHIEGNHITVIDGYAIVFYMDDIGEELQNNAQVLVGQVSISTNILSAGSGLLIDYFQCGYRLYHDSSCTLGDFQIVNNIIESTEYGVELQQFSYLGYELSDNATFTMGDIHLDDNQIQSGSHGIYFSQLLIGEDMSDYSICSISDITLNDNIITSGGDGILFIDDLSSFRLGNSMSENSVVSVHDIEVSRNTISDSGSGIFIGPCLFGGENDKLTVHSFTITNNSISFCSTGLKTMDFSISDWCQPVIKNNTIENCNVGIWFDSSYGSLIYNNYFDNTLNAKDDTENTWNVIKTAGKNIIGGSYLGGNFWSDYTGVDGDDDTLGDTLIPYNAKGNISTGGDLHPLTHVSGNLTLTPPTDFTATVIGTHQINLSWTKGIHAVYTRVMQKIGGYPVSVSDGSLVYNGTGTACSNSSLSAGVHYYFRAWSWNDSTKFWSMTNASVNNTTWIVPLVPSGFSATTVDTDEISLTWTKGSYATYTRIQGNIGSFPGNINDGTNIYNGTLSQFSNSGLVEGTHYYYRAWSWNSSSRLWSSSNASASNTTWSIPLAPTGFHAATVGVNKIDLSWTKGTHAVNTRVMQKIGGYPVSVSDGSLVYNGTNVACSNSSLTAGVHYYYRAWSWNSTSKLWSSTNVSVSNTTWNIPLAPTGFRATTIGSNQINLSWTKGSYALYTRIQRKSTGYPVSISDGTPVYNSTGSSYPNTGLSVNTTYYYRAWSWNTTSKTWSTTIASVFNSTWAGPLAPPSLSATTVDTNQIDLSWTKGFRATHTRVMQKTGGYPVSVSDGSLVYNGTGVACSNSSLSAGVRYYFRAWSWNSSSGLWSTTNASGSNLTWIIPLAPNGFSATTVSTDEISITWTKGVYATYTRIQRNMGSYPVDINHGTNVYNGTSNIISDTDLTEDTQYYYRAWSWNSTSGLWSSTNATVSGTTWSNPLAPTGLSATTVAIDHINLSWTKGIHAVYTIVRQKIGDNPASISDGSLIYNGTGATSSSSSLTLGTRYYFKAWSWNDSSGIWSTSNSSTSNITGPFAPTGLITTVISTSQINLAWNKGIYANYTRIQRKTGSYPMNISDGINVYNATGSSYNNTDLSTSTKYYYRAWSWNSSLGIWSITYASVQASTKSYGGGEQGPPPSSDNEAPIANAGGPYKGYINQTITLNGAGSSDDVGVVGYRWDWTNDGTWDTNWSSSSKTTHIYTTAGNFTVNLQVQDVEDLRDNDTTTVTVNTGFSLQQAPVADAGGPYHELTYQMIQFNGSRSYGINTSIVNYTWVFGDGTYGYGVSPIHPYDSAGAFTVILTVKDTNNLQAIDTTLVTIVLDANRNNVSDIIDQAIGADITQADLHTVFINGVLYYLVDTNHDGIYDAFYNPTTNTKTILGEQDEKQLIDIDGDGHWDYIYDPALGSTTPYVEITTPLDSPWFSVALSVIIFMVILVVVWLYKTGRI